MSVPTPEGEPSDSATPPESGPPDPDAQTARIPVGEPPPADPPAPPAGIISANPVGWSGTAPPAPAAPNGQAPGGPASGWVVPAPQAAAPVAEGVVIAGVFARLVAYSIDVLFLLCINITFDALLGLYNPTPDDPLALAVRGLFIGFDFLYFVGLWTSGLQGTLGMRLLRLRVLDAVTAGTLPANDALLRWLALSGATSILMLVPGIGSTISLIGFVWVLALLVTTSTNRLHQGLHDRWARSVVVQPAPGGSGVAIVTCLVLVVIVAVVLPLLLLAVAGDQIQTILDQMGQSV